VQHPLHLDITATTQESLLVPSDVTNNASTSRGGSASSGSRNEKHKMRPKSAPKHRRPSPVVLDYPASNEEFSEEELRLPADDEEGLSSAISDQDEKANKVAEAEANPASAKAEAANAAEKVN
jgi:hypothetical protein